MLPDDEVPARGSGCGADLSDPMEGPSVIRAGEGSPAASAEEGTAPAGKPSCGDASGIDPLVRFHLATQRILSLASSHRRGSPCEAGSLEPGERDEALPPGEELGKRISSVCRPAIDAASDASKAEAPTVASVVDECLLLGATMARGERSDHRDFVGMVSALAVREAFLRKAAAVDDEIGRAFGREEARAAACAAPIEAMPPECGEGEVTGHVVACSKEAAPGAAPVASGATEPSKAATATANPSQAEAPENGSVDRPGGAIPNTGTAGSGEIRPPGRDARILRNARRIGALAIVLLAALGMGLIGLSRVNRLTEDEGPKPTGRAAVDAVVERIIRAESNGDANAKNKRSSATGPGQFLDETWLDMIRAYRPDLARGRNEKEILELRRNPDLAHEITMRFVERNAAALSRRGLPVTPGTLYLAHFAGSAGAIAVLSVPDDTDAADLMAKADASGRTTREKLVNANPFLASFTVADLKKWADRKMEPRQLR
jgi:hypothetical protein